jgi:hypothetical protein
MNGKNKNYRYYFTFFLIILLLIFLFGCDGITPNNPVINSFLANPPTITEGETSILSWSVTDADSVSIDNGVGAVPLTGTTTVNPTTNTTYNLTAMNSVGSSTAIAVITVNPIPTFTISQTEGTAEGWFGASPTYINVGQGQSFQVTENGFFDQFQIYLTSTQPTDSGDIIVCDLRDSSGNVLQSATINGFTAGNGGWRIFNFNALTYVTPGTYYCTCYISNPIADHWYSCHANTNSDSYPGGSRYVFDGEHPEDWSSWYLLTWDWDLFFKVIIKMIP